MNVRTAFRAMWFLEIVTGLGLGFVLWHLPLMQFFAGVVSALLFAMFYAERRRLQEFLP